MQTLKLTVVGPYGAGTTTFIRNFPPLPRKPRKRRNAVPDASNTAPIDNFGCIEVDRELCIQLYGSPGHERFDFMWEILAEGAPGFIFIVDSTRPETFREAHEIFEKFQAYVPVPVVVAANKQDQPGALLPNDIKKLLYLRHDIQVLPCIATDPESCKKVLLALLHAILGQPDQPLNPTPPMVFTPIADGTPLQVSRAKREDCQRIAAFFNACNFFKWDAEIVYLNFGQNGYWLATAHGELVGVARCYVRNLVMGVELVISPLAPREQVGAALLDEVHKAGKALEIEFAFARTYKGLESAFAVRRYQKMALTDLEFPIWRKAVQAAGLQETLGLQLRPERVVKPI